MVQVLPPVPSFGEKLSQVLAESGGKLAEGLQRRHAQTAWQQLITPTQTDQNGNPIQNQPQGNQAPSNLSPLERMKQKPGGLSLNETISAINTAERAFPGVGGKAVSDYLGNEQKISGKRQLESERHERELTAPGDKQFFEKIAIDRQKLPDEELSNAMILDAIGSGDIDPWSSAHIGALARAFGAPDELTRVLETPGSKEFKSGRKTFIGNTIKDAFKGTTTKTEINLVEDMLAELGVAPEANYVAAIGMQTKIDIAKEKIRLTDELQERGVNPSKIPAAVDKLMQPIIKEIHDEYFTIVKEQKKKFDARKAK